MFDNRKKRTELSELGEFGLIDHLTRNIRHRQPATIKGVGDDAAVLDYQGKKILVSTDLLLEGVHFDLTFTPLKHLGYKAAIVNFSDIAAMNSLPAHLTVSIAVSNRFSLEAIEEIYSGIQLACDRYQVDLIGGDTSSSVTGLMMSLTVLGEAEESDITYRDTARENDLICVSGDLGAAYMGLLLLEREKKVFNADPSIQPDLGGNDYILQRQLKPEARVDIVRKLKALKVKPTAMIDISDGLASEVLHICTDSETGCAIYEEKIPVDPATLAMAQEMGIDPTICALNGGEDYELLFTIDIHDYDTLKDDQEITVIGHMTHQASGMNLITRSGTQVPLRAQGWDAFKERREERGERREEKGERREEGGERREERGERREEK
ncbi:MAG TPA: thiamine-phosphate kinase [Bacteroidales bacterium]|nr:thiamine-phosphate kinase [Bacteroidales bacterium]HNS47447.1 thiamine-phosphate kinase [Bacteroidales bacterium]